MVEFFQVLFLAVVQGIAEFLPISSSGHLAVLGQLFGFDPESNVHINIILHAGTLVSILVFYFYQLIDIVKDRSKWRVILLVIIGSIPAAIVGIGIKMYKVDELFFNSLWLIGICFLVTGLVLMFAEKGRKDFDESQAIELEKMPMGKALAIGVAQAIAILPGISRSGSTIAAGLKVGLKKADCAKFSFLLAIVAIGGAGMIDLLKAIKDSGKAAVENSANTDFALLPLIVGFSVSAVVGYFSLKFLLGILQRGKLNYFSWYLFFVGTLVLGIWIGLSI